MRGLGGVQRDGERLGYEQGKKKNERIERGGGGSGG